MAFTEELQPRTFNVNASSDSKSLGAGRSADQQFRMNPSRSHDHGMGL